MNTGIIESLGRVQRIEQEGSNYHFTINSELASELQVDQSLAHNGVCLTVVKVMDDAYVVTAILETMQRSNLGDLKVGDFVNLERAMLSRARLDGHIVQGHVDGTGRCESVAEADGSWYYRFSHSPEQAHLLVDKGSICVNGVSLTVVDPTAEGISVAIIPYTYEHTTFQQLRTGMRINLEYDIIGKYVARMAAAYEKKGLLS